MTCESGSLNTVAASPNVTPCLRSFARALVSSHSKVNMGCKVAA